MEGGWKGWAAGLRGNPISSTWRPPRAAFGFDPVLLRPQKQPFAGDGDPPSRLLSAAGGDFFVGTGGGYLLKGYVSRTPSREPNRFLPRREGRGAGGKQVRSILSPLSSPCLLAAGRGGHAGRDVSRAARRPRSRSSRPGMCPRPAWRRSHHLPGCGGGVAPRAWLVLRSPLP
ncbi:hypothetical protein PVAP13_2NG268606 [Panicum virgatum]|uniref:Uncharacterized protein n=1 Tax=Panicum virgatum TaxID=38727 RepID=A0A8T0VII2_PANVG|nr:hypothetical protein PVAP13_2NG268606 [Panicum virgatum]